MNNIHARSLKAALLILPAFLLSFLLANPASAQYEEGKALFTGNCASCHKPDKKVVGPALMGSREKWEKRVGKEALYSWVKNSQGYIEETGDPYAVALLAEYNGSVMSANAISNEEIDLIFAYIDNYTPPPPPPGKDEVSTNAGNDGPDNTWLWLILIFVVLFIIGNVLLGVRKALNRINREKEGKEPLPESSVIESILEYLSANKRITALLVILVLGWGASVGWDALLGVGVYEGYAPEQPIKFSHKIHAGQNGINCVYCHHSAEKGKHSGIPSVNVCMNCHTGIQEGAQYGKTEIAKIHDAAGYDAEAGKYRLDEDGNRIQKPIEWVRIHNLPDFAYFNHSQHVIVGKQECQTCHGEVEEYDYPMKQHAPLTMGWCINCHRETNIDMTNGYYQDMKPDFLEKYSDMEDESFKVEHIGGLECAKCHY